VAAHDGKRDAGVDGERSNGGPNHPAFDDLYGRAETLDSFVAEPGGKEHEKDSVGERGERSGAMVAVGFVTVGGAFGPAHGEPGDAEGRHIRKIVHGVVQESDAAAKDAAENFGEDETKRGDHGPGENGWFERRMNVAAVRMTTRMVVNVAGVGVVVHESIFYDMETNRTLGGVRRKANRASTIGPDCWAV
jgi:hypothetical protein